MQIFNFSVTMAMRLPVIKLWIQLRWKFREIQLLARNLWHSHNWTRKIYCPYRLWPKRESEVGRFLKENCLRDRNYLPTLSEVEVIMPTANITSVIRSLLLSANYVIKYLFGQASIYDRKWSLMEESGNWGDNDRVSIDMTTFEP